MSIKPFIELILPESGDWEVLRMNLGEDYKCEGHSIGCHLLLESIHLIILVIHVKIVELSSI